MWVNSGRWGVIWYALKGPGSAPLASRSLWGKQAALPVLLSTWRPGSSSQEWVDAEDLQGGTWDPQPIRQQNTDKQKRDWHKAQTVQGWLGSKPGTHLTPEYFTLYPLPSGLQSFSREIWSSYRGSLVWRFAFLLACFQNAVFLKVWVYISDFILVFLDFLNIYVHVFDQIWEVFSHYFFKCSTSFSLLGHLWFLCWFACWCPTDLLSWGHFSSIFFVSGPQSY